jgi:hypothetical protein
MSDTGWTAFHARWGAAGGAERANYQLFLTELLEVPRPDPAGEDTGHNAYVFERAVPLHQPDGSHTTGRIDLYKRGGFVLEAKQYSGKPETSEPVLPGETQRRKSGPVRGTERWDDAMLRARSQAEGYARNLPAEEEPPPFLLVVDVGHTIELYADFTQKGKAYQPFPDPLTFRIRLADLDKADIRARLRAVWTDPLSLDPARHSAAVTREVAEHLAGLAKSFEAEKHAPQLVAEFLSRCLFCMFAEDVGLLPKNSFSGLLNSVKGDPGAFVPLLQGLFNDMAKGTDYSLVLRQKILRFNGGLFEAVDVLRVNETQLALLRAAAKLDWRNVEPAIFGTLLERALTPEERHKLGAHYTPRAYVERLVLPTIIEPLRAEWDAVKGAAVTLMRKGDYPAARKELSAFHRHLCAVTVLDPACGSGNFLYVTMEMMKRLEGEVIDLLDELGVSLLELESVTVDPHQFHGIELNPRAAAITDLVLWIGYLQWHFRTRGSAPPAEPILRKFRNIECRDAVLAYDKEEPVRDDAGKIATTWDRKSYKVDPVTGREVPDESKRTWLHHYTNPRPAEWPQTDYIVGNPPFLGASRLREDLGDGYAETLRETYPDIPESADFVMVWWHKAAELVRAGKAKRFGLITTNSLRQTFNRRVVQAQLKPRNGQRLSLVFAIPDHPWVDTAEGAAVRIAMTVGQAGESPGHLLTVIDEAGQDDGAHVVRFRETTGIIQADLTVGAEVTGTQTLQSNEGLSSPGVKLHGSGFIVTPEQAEALGYGTDAAVNAVIHPYRNGRDLTDRPRNVLVIDLFGLTAEEARVKVPKVYQHVLATVKPERDAKSKTKDGAGYARYWWLFGKPRQELRPALRGLSRYIATGETAKHRVFQFLDAEIRPDNMLIVIASDDAFHLGVLSSRAHILFALSAGGRLGYGNDPRYNKSRCFDPFPFPACTEAQKEKIRALAEELDAHRKRAQAAHGAGLTDMYNVVEKLRAGEGLDEEEKELHDRALLSTLKQLHDDLDVAVADAYAWSWPMEEAEILERVVALNRERAAEEARGVIRWLRPEYQERKGTAAPGKEEQPSLGLTAKDTKRAKGKKAAQKKLVWPKTLPAQVKAVAEVLAAEPQTAEAVARRFARAKASEVREILEALAAMGRARRKGDGYSL